MCLENNTVQILLIDPPGTKTCTASDMPNTRHLALAPTPFRPTLLSIPPSPQSPLSPLEDPLRIPPRRPSAQLHRLSLPSPASLTLPHEPQISTAFHTTAPPTAALPWIWQCHICHRAYPLGVTRRCLDDGHRFCAGQTHTTAVRTRHRHASARRRGHGKACASEFDYAGWRAWGEWRRGEVNARLRVSAARYGPPVYSAPGCSGQCDYPSECLWSTKATKQIKPDTPITAVFTQDVEMVDSSAAADDTDGDFWTATSFEEILGVSAACMQNKGVEEEEDVGVLRLLVDKGITRKGRQRRKSSPLAGGDGADPGLFIIEEELQT